MNRSILNHPLISERYFFPRRETFAEPYWIDAGEARLACHYHKVDPEALTVVHFHGNGEVVADYVDFLPHLFARLGCNSLLAEFRGYGMSSGRAELGGILDDVDAIIEQTPSPVERIVVFGRSVGSIPALHAAAQFPNLAGTIIESGIADVLERLLLRVHPMELGVSRADIKNAVADRLDQTQKIAGYAGPLLIMHTARDGLVDVEHAESLYEAAGSRNKKIHIFQNGDHNSIMMVNSEEYFGLVGDFLQKIDARGTPSRE